ncbi:MAG: MaoC family dehydratase [Erysipelothrix sp.]|nr:MaoC family dehydratase [Erysipelothrix sp.]
MNNSKTISQIEIGDQASTTRTFTEQEVVDFAKLSGDNNPLHLNEDFAQRTSFKHRIVHGHLVSSMYSDILGSQLPGLGTIYLKQRVTYTKPVFLGDTITSSVVVLEKDLEKNRVKLETRSINQNGELVIIGEAVVLPPLKEVTL